MNERWCASRFFLPFLWLFSASLLFSPGCSRSYYREAADEEVYSFLKQKSQGRPWMLEPGFSIDPQKRSRLYDPSDPDFPRLPDPRPRLYSYQLPGDDREGDRSAERMAAYEERRETIQGLQVQPIPEKYWGALPEACLSRMLEFQSVQLEYRKQYREKPPAALLDASRRLALDAIVEYALLNSREYQAQKEQLYEAALEVTHQWYRYFPHFSGGQNGAGVAYSHSRYDGSTDEDLSVTPGFGFESLLIFGGSLFLDFANKIVLTFEGPGGFSREVSSDLIARFSRSIFQNDRTFESLVQSERSLVYALRSYVRYRRKFFLDLAGQYYSILRSYRNIEIESQNYFSLVRTFEQARAEVRADVKKAPNPVAVDQYEQSMLSGRSTLISRCNSLESQFDRLKFVMGLPTEMPVNIDLHELDLMTLRDRIEVEAERVRRWRNRVEDRCQRAGKNRFDILNAGLFLTERTMAWITLQKQLDPDVEVPKQVRSLFIEFQVELARIEVERNREELNQLQSTEVAPPLILLYQRTSDIISFLSRLVEKQIDRAVFLDLEKERIERAKTELAGIREEMEKQGKRIEAILQDPRQEKLEILFDDAKALLQSVNSLVAALDAMTGEDTEIETPEKLLEESISDARTLLTLTGDLLESSETYSLPSVGIGLDDAMETALVNRFDLMNERGRLADRRRSVKLAADDLKSVVDIDASHTLSTEDDKPFAFTGERNRTQGSVHIDLPLDRNAERNSYRRALISYQAGRRALMEQKDAIKQDVRNLFRTLDEGRLQYPISVTRAALAAEQVISVQLQLSLGVEGVRGTDLLDALQASREALSSVANARISYIVDRASFIFDLELMELDEEGLWPQINDLTSRIEPRTVYPDRAGPVYGGIPGSLWISDEIRSMSEISFPAENTSLETGGDAPDDS